MADIKRETSHFGLISLNGVEYHMFASHLSHVWTFYIWKKLFLRYFFGCFQCSEAIELFFLSVSKFNWRLMLKHTLTEIHQNSGFFGSKWNEINSKIMNNFDYVKILKKKSGTEMIFSWTNRKTMKKEIFS